MITTKSPRFVVRTALAVAQKALPPYTSRFSPKKYTQPQLVACLVLKEFLGLDYRGVVALLADSTDVSREIKLVSIPHFTTLQKASRELLRRRNIEKLMRSILAVATDAGMMHRSVPVAAMDGTGFESRAVSGYFVARERSLQFKGLVERAKYFRYPKVGLVCDVANHLILTGIPELGPRFDREHFREALVRAVRQKPIKTLLADRIYDAETHHAFAEQLSVRPVIRLRTGKGVIKSPRRRSLADAFPLKLYRLRAHVETVVSMLKRNMGTFTRARRFQSRSREILLRLFTHNVAIVLPA